MWPNEFYINSYFPGEFFPPILIVGVGPFCLEAIQLVTAGAQAVELECK